MFSRIVRLREAIGRRGWDAVLVWSLPNVYYLSGFTGHEESFADGYLLITVQDALLLTDSRYTEQAELEAGPRGFQKVIYKEKLKAIGAKIVELGISRLGYEDDAMTVAQFRELREQLGTIECEPVGSLISDLRLVKNEAEIAAIRRAIAVQEEGMRTILPALKPGAMESDLAFDLEMAMKKRGASALSFETIIASGPRGALPHGAASEKRIQTGELVVLDWGCFVAGYCSDQTLTVSVGEPADPDARRVYDIVKRAQRACVESIRPGMAMRDIDQVARKIIADAGYGDYFGHGTGHGVGLQIHEGPRCSPLGKGEAQVGMVFTVEPGIYLPGRFGVRIEDIVQVTAQGAECLTTMSKDWYSTL